MKESTNACVAAWPTPSDPAGQHRGGQNGPQFAYDGDVDNPSQARSQTQRMKLAIRLHRQDHTDEGPGNGNDRDAAYADKVKVRNNGVAAGPAAQEPAE